MHYKKYRKIGGVVMSACLMLSMTACGTSANTADTNNTTEAASETKEEAGENTFTYTDDTEGELVSTTVMAMVESVSGNEVTLSVGGGMGGGPQGEKPEGMPEGEMPTEMPEGEAPTGDMPQGEKPEGEAPEKPDGDAAEGEAPEKPDGDAAEGEASTENQDGDAAQDEAPTGDMPQGEKPEGMPEGEAPTGDMPEGGRMQGMSSSSALLTIGDESVIKVAGSDGEAAEGTISDITEGAMLQITFDENGAITEITVASGVGDMKMGAPGGQSNGVEDYDAVTEYTEETEVSSESFSSTGTDENAILVSNGAKVTLDGITVDRTSADSTGGDNSSFYGVGAAVLTTDGTTYISDAAITTDAAGGAGVFSCGNGVTYITDSTISTTQNTSGGIHAAGGGTLYAWNVTAETEGESAAAIRSDRGGGTMVIDGGTYTSHGVGSPALYCTADITVNNATLTATGSEAVCMEGLNTIRLFDCDVTGNMSDLEVNDTTWTMIVYQSMSGDSEVGNSTMHISGGTITSENGGLIYTTNTESNILLSDVDITYADDSEFFLRCTGNNNQRGWGTEGANGAQCTFTADTQEMQGDVIWDSISELDFYMVNGSSLTGAVMDDESCAGEGGSGYCNIYISEDSVWNVTGDSTVTNLYNAGSILDENGKTVSIVGTDGTLYVEGDSAYTITVDSYEASADLSGAATVGSWSDYEVAKPAEIA